MRRHISQVQGAVTLAWCDCKLRSGPVCATHTPQRGPAKQTAGCSPWKIRYSYRLIRPWEVSMRTILSVLTLAAAFQVSSVAIAEEKAKDEFFWLGQINKATIVINSE